MTYKEKEEKIIEWFRNNGVFEKFIDNLHTERPYYDPFAKGELDVNLIIKSFRWIYTTEGWAFWNYTNKKYEEFYKNLMTNNMEKSVKIEVPEGYEIDKEKSTFENIVFKKKEAKPWRKETHNVDGYYITGLSAIKPVSDIRWMSTELNIFATKKQAKSALAMAQISQIMANDPRFGGPVTDEEWEDNSIEKYVIMRTYDGIEVDESDYEYEFLAFHTEEQRDLFLKENWDLVKDYLMIDYPLLQDLL